MKPNVVPFPPIQICFDIIRERISASFNGSSTSGDSLEDTRNSRQFIQEMLHRNPDAFKGEVDVQSMMQMYPGQI